MVVSRNRITESSGERDPTARTAQPGERSPPCRTSTFAAFDADHHYYEAEDAFTRHIEPKMQRRAMQWGVVNGRKCLLVAGKVNRFIPESDLRSGREARLSRRVLPRPQPRRQEHPRGVRRARADQPGLSQPRRAHRADGHARASRGCSCSPRSASAWRSRSSAIPRRCAPRSAPSTAGCTKTGASRTRSGCSRRPTSRSSTSTTRCASSSGRSPTTRA